MNKLITLAAVTLGLLAGDAFAANPACEVAADEKKLAGEARTSFAKKCVADAAAARK